MTSPFPGMDPYLEDPALWPDVHHALIETIREFLVPRVRPKYAVRVEQRAYVNDVDDPAFRLLVPDLRVVTAPFAPGRPPAAGGGIAVTAPVPVAELLDEEVVEARVEIIDRGDKEVVTVLEVVSPSNKVRLSASRRSFADKRRQVVASAAHWVEIDLLRAGARTLYPTGFGPSDYFVYLDKAVAGGRKRFAWPVLLPDRLPVIAVPLRDPDPDVPLDLQEVLTSTYRRAGYDLEIDYAAEVVPPLSGPAAAWLDNLLREKGSR